MSGVAKSGMQGSVVANSRLDGLNISTTAFPVEMLERMDVLNGPARAVRPGEPQQGGLISWQKRPTEETLRKVTLGYQAAVRLPTMPIWVAILMKTNGLAIA